MSTPKAPDPACLVIGLFTASKERLLPVYSELCSVFGKADLVSPWFSFHHTRYYEKEMGFPLFRRMLSFATAIGQDCLAWAKTVTNAIERGQTAPDGSRTVNLDPGLLAAERFVLATGKNYSHRIYLGRGIFADLTLTYGQGRYSGLPWTYPDYLEEEMNRFLLRVRSKYLNDLRLLKLREAKERGFS